MKIRTAMLAFTALLLSGSLAATASTTPAPTTAEPIPAAAMMSQASSCDAALPLQNPSALPAVLTCGSCGDQWCPGYAVGSYCTYLGPGGYRAGTCQIVDAVCSSGGGFECACQ